jgi:hypothetical protein
MPPSASIDGMSIQQIPAEVETYFAELEPARRDVLVPVFDMLRRSMPDGYELGLNWGMPTWTIPLSTYPNTYNKQPLAYVSLAAQKNHNSLYLMALYSNSEQEAAFQAEWADAGLKLNMGKSCLRFRTLADLDLGILARTVASVSVDDFLATYERIKPPSRS